MWRIFSILGVASILAIAISPAAYLQKRQPGPVIVVKAGHLIDVKAGVVRDNQTIIIEGERIKSVGASLTVPAGAQVIDLSSMTVLPGLIDCHTHLLQNLSGGGSEISPSPASRYLVLSC
jgi:imidazolonepropionase-like amidohydrolase